MRLVGVKNKEKDDMIEYHNNINNPSVYTSHFYPRYHTLELTVFNSKVRYVFNQLKDYLVNNTVLEKRYTKHYSYALTRKRQCKQSYSSTIPLIFAYSRKVVRPHELFNHFFNESGLQHVCHKLENYIPACRSYVFLTKAEYIKVLNTHSEGCFVIRSFSMI